MNEAILFRNLLIMAASDGKMSESELRLLTHRAAEWGITDDQFEDAIQDALTGRADLELPTDPVELRRALKEMIHMMAADGRISAAEKRLFALASAAAGWEATEVDRLIDELLREDG